MKYYITSDIHGFYSVLIEELTKLGFFSDTCPHKLVVCGDLFDRGEEAKQLQDFIVDLINKDEVILIKGNHEYLLEDLLFNWCYHSYGDSHHNSNGTVKTVLQITNKTKLDLWQKPYEIYGLFKESDVYNKILPKMINYYEIGDYICCHGWLPTELTENGFKIITNWEKSSSKEWYDASWTNGMELAHEGAVLEGKTIICGHWHTSFGHSKYLNDGSQFGGDANFSIYRNKGIISLDACTAHSHKINVLVIEK